MADWRYEGRGARIIAGVLCLFGAFVFYLGLTATPSPDPNVTPWWVAPVAGVILWLVALGLVLPARQAIVAFSALFVLAALVTIAFPFRPGPLESTLEIFTPFGYVARRLGDTPTRIMAAILAFFVIGIVAAGIPQALKDEFGEKRWLSAIQGVGLLMILPFLFGMIALLVVLGSPLLLWRYFEVRRERRAAREHTLS